MRKKYIKLEGVKALSQDELHQSHRCCLDAAIDSSGIIYLYGEITQRTGFSVESVTEKL